MDPLRSDIARNVVDLRLYRDPKLTPLLILVDPQREYESEDRALGLPEACKAIENCRKLLSFCRAAGFPVAFIRWRHQGHFFGLGAGHGSWIDGLSPTGSDMVFERDLPSCYASAEFTDMMARGGGSNAVIAGFTGTIACLSTIIDAYHRQHQATFVSDASASHPTNLTPERAIHESVSDIISLYCPVVGTDQWISDQSNLRRPMNRSHQ